MSLLVVQHQRTCPPGRFGDWLTDAGVELDVRRPDTGDSLPIDLSGHDGLLVLGGQMGCRDDEVAPWLPAVRQLITTAAKGATPTLGICLGHQLAAVALGDLLDTHEDPGPHALWAGVAAPQPSGQCGEEEQRHRRVVHPQVNGHGAEVPRQHRAGFQVDEMRIGGGGGGQFPAADGRAGPGRAASSSEKVQPMSSWPRT